MGQRHQIFLIARILGQYRCLAAVHRQWLYGFSALNTCVRLRDTFQDPLNRRNIRHELHHATTLDNDFWNHEEAPNAVEPFVPFPVAATCLMAGATSAPGAESFGMAWLLAFGTEFDQGDNNDGVTVLDITDLERVRYCFAAFDGVGAEIDPSLRMKALSAARYLHSYYPKPNARQRIPEAFDSYPMIATSDLDAIWPRDDWDFERHTGSRIDFAETKCSIPPSTGLELVSEGASQPKSLTQMSRETVIAQALLWNPEQVSDFLAHELQDNESWEQLYDSLRADPRRIEVAPGGIELLARSVQGRQDVDLSPFRMLTNSDMGQILRQCRSARHLDISGNPRLTAAGLDALLDCTLVHTLRCINCPGITLDQLQPLLQQAGITDVVHSELFLRGIIEVPSDCCASNPSIVQLVAGYAPNGHALDGSHFQWKNCGSSDMLASCLDLTNDLLPLHRLAVGLSRLISTIGGLFILPCLPGETMLYPAVALALSGASRNSVFPLGGQGYARHNHMSAVEVLSHPLDLAPGQWTALVLAHNEFEGSPIVGGSPDDIIMRRKLSYAMISRDNSDADQLNVVDFPTFIDHVAKDASVEEKRSLVQLWATQSASLGGSQTHESDTGWVVDPDSPLGVCMEEEVREFFEGALRERQERHKFWTIDQREREAKRQAQRAEAAA